jgi:hypothetical protein
MVDDRAESAGAAIKGPWKLRELGIPDVAFPAAAKKVIR